MKYLEELAQTIRDLHGSEPTHVKTVPVKEYFEGKLIWDGEVEVFDLKGHPKAKRAYAWSHVAGEDDKQRRYVTVLHLPPVNSPHMAVKIAIAQEIRERERTEEN